VTDILDIRGLSVTHRAPQGPRRLLSDVDLRVGEAETVGIVGESGSGKSLTAKAVMQLLPPQLSVQGKVLYRGEDLLAAGERRMAALRGSGISLLMQDPFTMLDPLQPCGAQVSEGLRLAMPGASRRELQAETLHRMAEVGIRDPDVATRYPFQMSGGMRQRDAPAGGHGRSAGPQPAAADRRRTLDRAGRDHAGRNPDAAEIVARGARHGALADHPRPARGVFGLRADQCRLCRSGAGIRPRPIAAGPPDASLCAGSADVGTRAGSPGGTTGAIPGTVLTPDAVATTCAFAPRCTWRAAPCTVARPPLVEVASGHITACVRIADIAADMAAHRTAAAKAVASPPLATPGLMTPLLELRGGQKTFDSRSGPPVVALRNIDITIGVNESVGIVGESGSGKTTLGRCVVGLETLTAGRLLLNGADFGPADRPDRAAQRRLAQIVFQDPYSSLNPRHGIGGTLAETLRVNDVAPGSIPARTGELLDIVGLPHAYAARYPRQLPGGERQRVAIARALAVGPRLLVCDEPVSALDVSVQAQILTLFRDLRARLGLSTLFITHDLAVVRQVVERVYVMHRAEVVEHGPVDEVLTSPRHAYTRQLISSIPGGNAPQP
jgi:peptide/nickel transport system ATP-binding protein